MLRHIFHPSAKLLNRFVRMLTGEVSVQEPPDVSYHGLVQVEITEASRQPIRGGVLPPQSNS